MRGKFAAIIRLSAPSLISTAAPSRAAWMKRLDVSLEAMLCAALCLHAIGATEQSDSLAKIEAQTVDWREIVMCYVPELFERIVHA